MRATLTASDTQCDTEPMLFQDVNSNSEQAVSFPIKARSSLKNLSASGACDSESGKPVPFICWHVCTAPNATEL